MIRGSSCRLAQIEESVARYLHQLDSADRQEPSLARTTKTTRLKEKIPKLKEEMQRLEALDVRMLATSIAHDPPPQQSASSNPPQIARESYHAKRFHTARAECELIGGLILFYSSVWATTPTRMESKKNPGAMPRGPIKRTLCAAWRICRSLFMRTRNHRFRSRTRDRQALPADTMLRDGNPAVDLQCCKSSNSPAARL
jgi:hypothetical protein